MAVTECDRGRGWDVVVAGGGNAALVAAIAARQAGACRVLLLERAPREFRGGNSRHTRNMRCVRRPGDDYAPGTYTYDELWTDLCGVGEGPSNEQIAGLTVSESESVPAWMEEQGIRWQPALTGTLSLARTNRFFLGGGKALINSYYRRAEHLGITVRYDSRVDELVMDGPRCAALRMADGGQIAVRALVCASGGFEANLDWLARYWGEQAVANYVIRGPRYNDGRVLAQLFAHGADKAGQEKGFHAIALDARSPKFDGGIATRLDVVPFGVVVNREGRRFYDEGEDIWPKRYAIWGRQLAEQPGQIGYGLWDAKVNGRFLPPMYGAYRADTLGELFSQLDLPAETLDTVERYNGAVRPGTFDPARLDGCRTYGLSPDKTNWAQRLDTPPFYGIPMRPGITFTYMGARINAQGQVQCVDGSALANVWAAGEIMSGNILSTGYMAGFGMTIGTVWGRIAGRGAASYDVD